MQSLVWIFFVLLIAGILGGGMISVAKVVNSLNAIITEAADGKSGVCISFDLPLDDPLAYLIFQVVLLGHVYNVDIPSRQIDISWLMIGCGTLRLPGTSTYGVRNCGRLARGVKFFVDGYDHDFELWYQH